MASIHFETGGTFSPSVCNWQSGATGLLQFTPRTLRAFGTNALEISCMTAEQQLDLVARYLRPYARRMITLADVYMAILWPRAIGWPEDATLFSRTNTASAAYLQNRGLDLNADGIVTKGEATAKVQERLERGMLPGNVSP